MMRFKNTRAVFRGFLATGGFDTPSLPASALRKIAIEIDYAIAVANGLEQYIEQFEQLSCLLHVRFGFDAAGVAKPAATLPYLKRLDPTLRASILREPLSSRSDEWLLENRIDLLAINMVAIDELQEALLQDMSEAWTALLDDEAWLAAVTPPPPPIVLTGAIKLCKEQAHYDFRELVGRVSGNSIEASPLLSLRPAAGGTSGVNELVVSRPSNGNPPPLVGFLIGIDMANRRVTIRRPESGSTTGVAADDDFKPEALVLRIDDMLLRPDPMSTTPECATFSLPEGLPAVFDFELLTPGWAEEVLDRLQNTPKT